MRIMVSMGVMLVVLLAPLASFGATGDVRLTAPDRDLVSGEEFVSEIRVELGAQPLGSYRLDVVYDSAILEIVRVEGGLSPEFAGAPVHNTTDYTDGSLRVAFAQAAQTALNTTATIARVTFGVIGSAGAMGFIQPDNVLLEDATLSTLPIASNPLTTQITVAAGSETCTLAVSGGSGSVPAGGGTTAAFNVDVTADTCSWTVSSSLGTTSVSGATGDGTFTVNVPENPGSTGRTIAVVVTPEGNPAGAVTKNITQGADACFTLTVIGGVRNTPTDCTTAGSAQGYSSASVVSITANAAPEGKVFDQWTGDSVANPSLMSTTITMDGDKSVTATFKDAPDCTLTVSGGSTSVPAAGGETAEFNVDISGSGCSWTATTTTAGVTITPSSGDTDGSFTMTIAENPGRVERNIAVIVTPEGNAEGAVTRIISQGSPVSGDCVVSTYGEPTDRFPGPGRTLEVLVDVEEESCEWSVSVDAVYATISPAAGVGDGGFFITVPENLSQEARYFSVTITPAGNPTGVLTKTYVQNYSEEGDLLGVYLGTVNSGESVVSDNFVGDTTANPSHCGFSDYAAVWFSWTPEVDGTATIGVNSNDFGALLSFYKLEEDGTPNPITCGEFFCEDGGCVSSRLIVEVDAGSEYAIRISEGFGGAGTFELAVSLDQAGEGEGECDQKCQGTVPASCSGDSTNSQPLGGDLVVFGLVAMALLFSTCNRPESGRRQNQ